MLFINMIGLSTDVTNDKLFNEIRVYFESAKQLILNKIRGFTSKLFCSFIIWFHTVANKHSNLDK